MSLNTAMNYSLYRYQQRPVVGGLDAITTEDGIVITTEDGIDITVEGFTGFEDAPSALKRFPGVEELQNIKPAMATIGTQWDWFVWMLLLILLSILAMSCTGI